MKKVLTFIFAVSFLGILHSEDWQPQPIGPFSGVNNRDNSYAIPAQNAQDALNIDLTPGGKSVRKRKGFGSFAALAITTSPVHGVYNFFDNSGNDVSLFFNDTRVTSSVNGGSATVLIATGTNGATWQCTDSIGFAYCNNTGRQPILKTDGVTVTNISGNIPGTMITVTPDRLVEAGFSTATSRIGFSKAGDFTTWGNGSLSADPIEFNITAPGSRITHIVYAFGRIMWFKNNSFGYILIGNQPAQADWTIKTVAYDLGTNDNTSVYREGILYFRGNDGHIYGFDGSTYQRMTREISGTISASQSRTSGAWTQTTVTDFSNGNLSALDSTSSPGDLQLNYFNDGFDSLGNWVDAHYLNGNAGWISSSGKTYPTASTSSYASLMTASTITISDQFYLASTVDFVRNISTHSIETDLCFANSSTQMVCAAVLPCSQCPSITTSASFFIAFSSYNASNSYDILGSSTSGNLPSFSGSHYLELSGSASGYYRLLWDGVVIVSTTNKKFTGFNRGWISETSGRYPESYGRYENYLIRSATGTYLSAVKNAPSLTTWDAFTANYGNNGGLNSFSIRASTNSIQVTSSTPSWTSINSGAVPTISTGTFFQIKDEFSITTATQQPIFNDFTQNWVEGSATDKMYATYFDDRLWFSIASGTGASTNNRIILYDMLNQTCLLYDIASNGFLVRQNRLYIGSSSSGNIYKFGDGDNDAGVGINSYWKSKDFFGGSPFATNEVANISFTNKSVANSSMTITYLIDGSSSTVYTMSQYNSRGNFRNFNRNISAGTVGNTYAVQFGNNAADQPWEVFGIQLGIRPKSWIPTP